jgi:hypothetical protein
MRLNLYLNNISAKIGNAEQAAKDVAKGVGKSVANTFIGMSNEGNKILRAFGEDAPDSEYYQPSNQLQADVMGTTNKELVLVGLAGGKAPANIMMAEGKQAATVAAEAGTRGSGGWQGPIQPYNRKLHYGNTPTAADRKAMGGQSPDHDPPLVQRYYEGDPSRGEKPGYMQTPQERKAGAKDRSRMKPATRGAQNSQGGTMSHYSRRKYKELTNPGDNQ